MTFYESQRGISDEDLRLMTADADEVVDDDDDPQTVAELERIEARRQEAGDAMKRESTR